MKKMKFIKHNTYNCYYKYKKPWNKLERDMQDL